MSNEVVVTVDHNRRLLIGDWVNAAGEFLLTIKPQHQDRNGEWRLSHSGLLLAPDVARELAPALLAMAESIDSDATEEGGEQ